MLNNPIVIKCKISLSKRFKTSQNTMTQHPKVISWIHTLEGAMNTLHILHTYYCSYQTWQHQYDLQHRIHVIMRNTFWKFVRQCMSDMAERCINCKHHSKLQTFYVVYSRCLFNAWRSRRSSGMCVVMLENSFHLLYLCARKSCLMWNTSQAKRI